jgi:hypothetical protein
MDSSPYPHHVREVYTRGDYRIRETPRPIPRSRFRTYDDAFPIYFEGRYYRIEERIAELEVALAAEEEEEKEYDNTALEAWSKITIFGETKKKKKVIGNDDDAREEHPVITVVDENVDTTLNEQKSKKKTEKEEQEPTITDITEEREEEPTDIEANVIADPKSKKKTEEEEEEPTITDIEANIVPNPKKPKKKKKKRNNEEEEKESTSTDIDTGVDVTVAKPKRKKKTKKKKVCEEEEEETDIKSGVDAAVAKPKSKKKKKKKKVSEEGEEELTSTDIEARNKKKKKKKVGEEGEEAHTITDLEAKEKRKIVSKEVEADVPTSTSSNLVTDEDPSAELEYPRTRNHDAPYGPIPFLKGVSIDDPDFPQQFKRLLTGANSSANVKFFPAYIPGTPGMLYVTFGFLVLAVIGCGLWFTKSAKYEVCFGTNGTCREGYHAFGVYRIIIIAILGTYTLFFFCKILPAICNSKRHRGGLVVHERDGRNKPWPGDWTYGVYLVGNSALIDYDGKTAWLIPAAKITGVLRPSEQMILPSRLYNPDWRKVMEEQRAIYVESFWRVTVDEIDESGSSTYGYILPFMENKILLNMGGGMNYEGYAISESNGLGIENWFKDLERDIV